MGQIYASPLRYPGGKASLYDFLRKVIRVNELDECIYAEAFAGGAGAALELLFRGHVSQIFLNDKDPFIYCFWKSVLKHTEELIKLINETPVTIDEWKNRKKILQAEDLFNKYSILEIGFTAFFLNRTNRSGILSAGPIGGKNQTGKWKIDARYNKSELIRRIQSIATFSDRIRIYNLDAIDFIRRLKYNQKIETKKFLLYLDPPYVNNGEQLYNHFYLSEDHKRFSKFIQKQKKIKWLISYDDDKLVHSLYKEVKKNIFEFNYFAHRTKVGRELIISSQICELPFSYTHYSKQKEIEAEGLQLRISSF